MTALRPDPVVATGPPVSTPPVPTPPVPTPPVLDGPARVDVTVDEAGRVVATLVGRPVRTTPAVLSRTLHGVLAAATDGHAVLVDLGRLDPDDPAVTRVLRCAHECARSRGADLQVLPHVGG